jgi:hypothetical protein
MTTTAKRFLLEQKFTALINRYEFFSYTNGQKGERLAFVEQKRLSFKEQITAWSSEAKTDVFFTLKAEKVFDVHGRYWVNNSDGQPLGYLRKAFGRSLLRSTWELYDAKDQLLLTVTERNLAIALLRRYGELIPLIGDFLVFLPFSFDFTHGEAQVGRCNRLTGLRDSYDIELTAAAPPIDDRLALALGLALDALQAR